MFSKEKGQTLMELIVVVSVSVIIIGALVFATISSLRNAQFSKNQAQATKLAQEGIEQVRVGRDRNQCIVSLDNDVNSWNGDDTGSCDPAESGSGAVWTYPISGTSGNCENLTLNSKCYFKVYSNGQLQMIGYSVSSIPSLADVPLGFPNFRRVVTLSDDSATYGSQKTVTVIVSWTDFSGDHQSQLTTILRNLTL